MTLVRNGVCHACDGGFPRRGERGCSDPSYSARAPYVVLRTREGREFAFRSQSQYAVDGEATGAYVYDGSGWQELTEACSCSCSRACSWSWLLWLCDGVDSEVCAGEPEGVVSLG